MDFLTYLILALIGAALLRLSWYRQPRTAVSLVYALIGAALIALLWRYGWIGLLCSALLLLLFFIPYRSVFQYLLYRLNRNALRAFAQQTHGKFEEHLSGLYTLQTQVNGHEVWVGNVLNAVHSRHATRHRDRTEPMLALVISLEFECVLHCSMTRGWHAPRYYHQEFRKSRSLVGGVFRMNIGSSHASEGTGENVDDLHLYSNPADSRFTIFYHIATNNTVLFEKLFNHELLIKLTELVSDLPQFELNLRPGSINIYTNLCNLSALQEYLKFLLYLKEHLRLMTIQHVA